MELNGSVALVTGGDRGSGVTANGAKVAAVDLAPDAVNGRILGVNRITEMVLTGHKFGAEKGLNAFLEKRPPTFR